MNSSLLINEFPLQVLPTLAKLIGLNEAIVLQQIHYWIDQNAKKGRNFHDGRYWTFNSVAKWREENFPFWTERTLERHFASLRKKGLIITGYHHTDSRNRTLWYSIDYDALNQLTNCGNAFTKNGESIPTNCRNGLRQIVGMDSDNFTEWTPTICGNEYIEQRIHSETTTETTTETTNNPDARASEKTPLAEKEPKPEPAKNPDESVEQKNVPPVVCEVANELQKPAPKRDIYFDKRQWEPYRELFNEHKPHIWAKVNCLTEPRISALQSLYRDYGEELLLTFKEALDAAKLEKWTNTRSISFEGFCKLIPALSEKNQVLRGHRSEKVEQIAEQARTIEGAFAPRDDDYPVLHLVRTW